MPASTTTELTLKPDEGDFTISLDFTNIEGGDNRCIEVASVGDMLVQFNPDAAKRQQEALETSSLILVVSNAEEQKLAVETVAVLKAYTNGIEKSREEVKRPFLDAGRAIDALAKKESKEALAEIDRVQKLLGGYQREQDRKAREAQEAAERAEQERIAENNRKIAEENRLRAEADRLAREAQEAAQGKGKKAAAAAELARTQAELAQSQADLLASQRRNDEAAAKFSPAVTTTEFVKPQGTINRQDWDIEVVNWQELIRAHGLRFVRCELDLQALKYYLGSSECADSTKIPGLKITPKTAVHVRAAK